MDHDREQLEAAMERAFELARAAGDRDDDPYGSVLLREGDIVEEASNRVWTDNDLALHPELTIARRVRWWDNRDDLILVTSTEPCAMCATGIAIAGIGEVVYSVSNATLAEEYDRPPGIPCTEVFDRYSADVEVTGPVLEADGFAVHAEYTDDLT